MQWGCSPLLPELREPWKMLRDQDTDSNSWEPPEDGQLGSSDRLGRYHEASGEAGMSPRTNSPEG